MAYVIFVIVILLFLWIGLEEAYNQGYRQGRIDEHLQSMGDDNDNK